MADYYFYSSKIASSFEFIDMLVTQPDDMTFSTGSKTQHRGRWRYQYSVSWTVKYIFESTVNSNTLEKLKNDINTCH